MITHTHSHTQLTCRSKRQEEESTADHEASHDPGEGEAQMVQCITHQDARGGVQDAGHGVDQGKPLILGTAVKACL